MNEKVNNDDIKSLLYEISKSKIIPNFRNLKSEQISYKNNRDIVTIIDIEVEAFLKKHLSQLIKNSNFIGEETYSKKPEILNYYNEDVFCWTVDPIDGTFNFVKGKKEFVVMIALSFSNKILQSWIYKPLTEDMMYACLNEGTFLNNNKCIIDNSNLLSNSIGSISSKYWDKDNEIKIKILKKSFKEVNSYGSIGCEYFDIVLGKRDFTILSKLSPWDHLPGVLIVREAGGNDQHFDGTPYQFNQKCNNLIVSNSKYLNIEIINKLKELRS